MNPKNTGTKVGILSVVLLVVLAIVGWNLMLPSRLTPTQGSAQVYSPTLYPAQIEGLAESCGDVYRWNGFTRENYPLLPKSALKAPASTIPAIENIVVPVAGYLAPTVLPKSVIKFYSRADDPSFPNYEVLRLMYTYDTTVIWYSPGLDDSQIRAIKTYISKHKNVMALPWDKDAQRSQDLPRGSQIAYASWGMSQNCLNWSQVVFEEYAAVKQQHPVKRVPQSELMTGTIADSGSLQPIDPLLLAQLRKIQDGKFPLPSN